MHLRGKIIDFEYIQVIHLCKCLHISKLAQLKKHTICIYTYIYILTIYVN